MIVQGYIYICVFLVQAEHLGMKIDDVGGSRPEWLGDRATWPRSALGHVSLTSSSPGTSRDKILTIQKSQVNLSPGKSLKLKNTQNRVFLSCRVITKTRGIDGKFP
jgi:hypothetical protein